MEDSILTLHEIAYCFCALLQLDFVALQDQHHHLDCSSPNTAFDCLYPLPPPGGERLAMAGG